MPKVTEAYLEARRQQILDAAALCFVQQGFHHTTVHDICQMAELSPGAVYRYFAGKEEIIEAMLRERKTTSAALIRAIAGREDTQEILNGLADAFFGNLENPQACALGVELWAEALRSPRIRRLVRDEMRHVTVPFVEIIRRAQDRGEVNPRLDAEAVAQVMLSFYEGLVLQRTADPAIDVRKYVSAMKAMMGGAFWTASNREGGDRDARLSGRRTSLGTLPRARGRGPQHPPAHPEAAGRRPYCARRARLGLLGSGDYPQRRPRQALVP